MFSQTNGMPSDNILIFRTLNFHIRLLLNDPNVYPEPQIFKPERFLPQGNEEGSKQRDPTKVVFGFGRRYFSYLIVLYNIHLI